jgi:hypothetical protein
MKEPNFSPSFCMTWNSTSCPKKRTITDGVLEQRTEKNNCAERREKEDEESCIMRDFIIYKPHYL